MADVEPDPEPDHEPGVLPVLGTAAVCAVVAAALTYWLLAPTSGSDVFPPECHSYAGIEVLCESHTPFWTAFAIVVPLAAIAGAGVTSRGAVGPPGP